MWPEDKVLITKQENKVNRIWFSLEQRRGSIVEREVRAYYLKEIPLLLFSVRDDARKERG
jgi:hypothetical protein